jgi:hypothetical protein
VDLRDAEDVVEVSMGEPDPADPPPALLRRGQEERRLFTGINQDGVGTGRIEDQIAVLGELAIGQADDAQRSGQAAVSAAASRALRNFSTAMAAVVASPTAVVTCRVSWARKSPAAKSPGIEVIMRSSVIR